MIKLIAFDLDGTVLRKDRSISDYTLDVLKRLSEKGYRLFPNTGRCLDAGYMFFKDFTGLDFIGCNNGARLVDVKTMENIWAGSLNSSTAIQVYRILEENDVKPLVFLGDVFYRSQSGEVVNRKAIRRSLKETEQLTEDIRQQGILKVMENGKYSIYKVSGKLPDLSVRSEIIRELDNIKEVSCFNALPTNIEVSSSLSSKGKVLEDVMKRYGFCSNEVLAIGDGNNDIEMLKAAGMAVAMKNSDPQLFPYADIITEHMEDEDGGAEILEKMFL